MEQFISNSKHWTNASVLALSGENKNPLEVITNKVQELVLKAIQEGWSGPPFDPLFLAEMLKVNVVPFADVIDARTVTEHGGKFKIEYNPNKSHSRIRFSIAHE